MIGYRFLPPAEQEMTEASLFYEAASTGLGGNFLDDVERLIERLREHPNLGQTISSNLRRTLLNRFPFSLIYSVEGDQIIIIAVAHYGRRPDYWQDRVE